MAVAFLELVSRDEAEEFREFMIEIVQGLDTKNLRVIYLFGIGQDIQDGTDLIETLMKRELLTDSGGGGTYSQIVGGGGEVWQCSQEGFKKSGEWTYKNRFRNTQNDLNHHKALRRPLIRNPLQMLTS